MIISRTPFRISFFGGGTDYPAWYSNHGGAVLATAIDKYCYITCRYLPPFFEHKHRIVYSRTELCNSIEEINHPAARETLRFLNMERGIEIHHDGDLPARSGMGSSSAFTVGLLNALHALRGEMPTKKDLALKSIHIEQDLIRETVGSQDQITAAYGGFNHVEFFPNGEFSVRPVTISAERLQLLNDHLMLFYTGIKRTAAEVADSYVATMETKKRVLRIMKDLVEESINLLSSGGELAGFGNLLHEAWQAKRSLSSAVTNDEVDRMYETARSAGAIGGKITGAGGGGFLLLFVPPELHTNVRKALDTLLHVPFRFEYNGSQIIYFQHEEDYVRSERERNTLEITPFRELDITRVKGTDFVPAS